MANSGAVTVRGRFAPGSVVNLHLRRGDRFGPSIAARKPLAKARYSKEGEATFTGLVPGEMYWVSQEVDGELRHAAVTAKEPREAKPKSGGTLDPGYLTQGLSNKRRIVTGARSTVDVEATRQQTAMPELHEKQDAPELAPGVGQADVQGPQRSATPMGEGVPVDPEEPQPRPSQDQVDDKTPQRSATPLGEATPKVKGELAPSRSQEDTTAKEPQRSNTEHGEAEPIPEPGDPVKGALRRDSSVAKARGETPANPREKSAPKPASSAKKKTAKKASARKRPAKKRSTAKKSTARKGSKKS